MFSYVFSPRLFWVPSPRVLAAINTSKPVTEDGSEDSSSADAFALGRPYPENAMEAVAQNTISFFFFVAR